MSVQLERQVRRMPSTKGYRSYHGKGGAGRIVLIVLLCLILLAAVGFLVHAALRGVRLRRQHPL